MRNTLHSTYLAWFDFFTKFLFHLRQFQDSTTFPAGQRLPTSGSIGAGRCPRASARRWRCHCQGRLNWRQSRPWSRYVRLPGKQDQRLLFLTWTMICRKTSRVHGKGPFTYVSAILYSQICIFCVIHNTCIVYSIQVHTQIVVNLNC